MTPIRFLLITLTLLTGNAFAKPNCDQVKAVVSEGDIIYLGLDNPFYERVARATGSWVSHVGFAMRDTNGEWGVYESKVPLSAFTPLCDYLDRGAENQVAIRRLPGLTADDLTALRAEADARMGFLYHLGFDYDSSRTFCSKFVYDVFAMAFLRRGKVVEIGTIETFGELLLTAERNLNRSEYENLLQFWQAWFLPIGGIPTERRTVTPHSQWIDSDLIDVPL